MSLQTDTADYWPVMHTTAPSIVHVNAGFFKRCKGKTLTFSVGLIPSKRGLNFFHNDITQVLDNFILKAALLTSNILQVLCEDIHRSQGVGEDGASQPGRLVDRQLLQRPDGACLGGRLEGVQSRIAGA